MQTKQTGLLASLRKDYDRIAKVGEIAIAEAHAAGVPAYYIDLDVDPAGSIIEHWPDGRRVILISDL
jgi:hypothetical protein